MGAAGSVAAGWCIPGGRSILCQWTVRPQFEKTREHSRFSQESSCREVHHHPHPNKLENLRRGPFPTHPREIPTPSQAAPSDTAFTRSANPPSTMFIILPIIEAIIVLPMSQPMGPYLTW